MIACVYYANPPPIYSLWSLLSLDLSGCACQIMARSHRDSVLAEVPFALPSLSVPHRVQAKFIFLGEVLDWPEENEQSRGDHGRAEVSSIPRLQSRNKLLANKFLDSYKFQLQAANKPGCFCYVSFSLLHAWTYVLWVILCEIGRTGKGWTKGAEGRTAVQLHDGELGQMTGLLVKQSVFQIDDICDWSSGREKVVNRVKP